MARLGSHAASLLPGRRVCLPQQAQGILGIDFNKSIRASLNVKFVGTEFICIIFIKAVKIFFAALVILFFELFL